MPYVNGAALYAILQSMGVPSRLVIFPNENHWVLTPQNAIYWHWEMQSWLARYIGGDGRWRNPSSTPRRNSLGAESPGRDLLHDAVDLEISEGACDDSNSFRLARN